METAVSRIAAFERGSLALTADEMTSTPHGWVARTPSLPVVRSLNQVGVSGPIGLEDALELLELHLGDLPYRQLVLEDEPAGERFAAELGPSGWKVDRNVLMVLTGAPDRGLDTSAVVEADEDDALVLMAAWTAEDEELRSSPAAHRQVLEATRRTWRARNARRFGVRGDDGALAGITMLYSDGQVAQVEDVYLDPSVRGRGLGRLLSPTPSCRRSTRVTSSCSSPATTATGRRTSTPGSGSRPPTGSGCSTGRPPSRRPAGGRRRSSGAPAPGPRPRRVGAPAPMI